MLVNNLQTSHEPDMLPCRDEAMWNGQQVPVSNEFNTLCWNDALGMKHSPPGSAMLPLYYCIMGSSVAAALSLFPGLISVRCQSGFC